MTGTQESCGGRDGYAPVDVFVCLARAGRFRDDETAEHVERVSRTCELIAHRLGFTDREAANLRVASTLHDIGKIGVPDAVLLKPGALTRAERALIERHPEIGYQILSGSSDPVMELAATIALTHHEWIDGGGYPQRLRGNRIPWAGRIAAVADVFDAITHDRPYRSALSMERAWSIMKDQRGTHFDADVLDAFEAIAHQILELRGQFPDTAARLSPTPPSTPSRLATRRRGARRRRIPRGPQQFA